MPKAIAVFDIDGTLLADSSAERIFLRYLLSAGELGPAALFRFALRFLRTLPRSRTLAIRGNKAYLQGKSRNRIEALAADCFETGIAPRLSTAGRRRIEEHRGSGLEIVLLSGTLDILLSLFQTHLRADHAHGTTLQVIGGRYTGKIEGIHPFGGVKAELVRRIYGGGDYDLAASYAYADLADDLEFLRLFGHPAIVNPSARLKETAREMGIATTRF